MDRPRTTRRNRRRPAAAAAPPADDLRAFLAAAHRHPDAAAGLVEAYVALPPPRRAQLREAAVADASGDPQTLQTTLLLLLAVEDDPTLAQGIADALFAGIAPAERPEPRALLGVGPNDEALFLVRPLHGAYVETAALSWSVSDGRVGKGRVDPLCRADEAERGLHALPDGLSYRSLPYREALDDLGRALWTHRRRHGAWPREARAVARFICATPRPSPGFDRPAPGSVTDD